MQLPPFLDPKKEALLRRIAVAVEKVGQTLVDPPKPIDCPGTEARLKGDIQSVDSEGRTRCYYGIHTAAEVLPAWAAAHARGAHELDGVGVYVVFDQAQYNEAVEESCAAAGIGVLQVTADEEFALVAEFFGTLPTPVVEEFRAAVTEVHSLLEKKLREARAAIDAKLQVVREHTEKMEDQKADEFRAALDARSEAVSEWEMTIGKDLDAVVASMDSAALDEIRERVVAGPPEPVAAAPS